LSPGTAEVHAAHADRVLAPRGVAVVHADVPHEVRNAGSELLRFVAVYAAPDVVTLYERRFSRTVAASATP
jgi:mannose-6-phosphate isomerase-like protein (cupin superfamily)